MNKVFFCWQATTPGNKRYIADCLKAAIVEFPDYEYDEATRGRRGAIDVNESILKKIDEANLFVADISKVYESVLPGKKLINSNVALEVGYALAKIPLENMALIFDKKSGDADKLPFDIRNLRRSEFSFNDVNKSGLTEMFKQMLKDHAELPALTTHVPRVYASLNSHNISGAIQMTFRNDDDERFVVHSFELGGKEVYRDLPLVQGVDTTFAIGAGMPISPYAKKIKYLSFVMSGQESTYRLKQRINLDANTEGLYNLQSFDVRLSEARSIKPWRKAEIEPMHASFDGRACRVTDYDTDNSFELRISGTCWSMLGSVYDSDNENIILRLAYALNNKFEGLRTQTVTFTSEDIVDEDLNATVESIY